MSRAISRCFWLPKNEKIESAERRGLKGEELRPSCEPTEGREASAEGGFRRNITKREKRVVVGVRNLVK